MMRCFLLNSSMISPVSFHLQFTGLKMRKWRGLISLQCTCKQLELRRTCIVLLNLLFILKLAPVSPTEHK